MDHLYTAMAKTVGLPLGTAAWLVLKGRIDLTGLHIPIVPELYLPVLQELEEQGIFESAYEPVTHPLENIVIMLVRIKQNYCWSFL